MKCIHCDSDTTYPVRRGNGGRCGNCLHPFAFEPKTDTTFHIADTLFLRAIRDCSAKDTHFFTERQLWYELNRLVMKKPLPGMTPAWGSAMGATILATGIGVFVFHAFLLMPVGIGGVIFCSIMGRRAFLKLPHREPVIPFDTFEKKYLDRWLDVHGRIEKMIPPITARTITNRIEPPSDVADYSFDRALIVEEASIAAMLVANRFHFENNCAILSYDHIFPVADRFKIIMEMLRRNPRLLVFALHDASPAGILMAPNLRSADWFPTVIMRIFDLGLRPQHAEQMKMLLRTVSSSERGSIEPAVAERLTPDEQQWLIAGNRAELAALRPGKLMRAIFQGFTQAGQGQYLDDSYDSGAIIFIDSGPYGVWINDPGSDVSASDSFG